MSLHEKPELNAKQVATDAMSSAAMLDRPTEERLYQLYRAFFLQAELARNWNIWNDPPWEQVANPAPPALTDIVMEAYRDELFLPDYAARSLHALRSSRGRAWFLTRWSYEEGKHLLALHEWLLRSGARTDEERTLLDEKLRILSDDLLTQYRWEPPFDDASAIFADSLLWEIRQIERSRLLRREADAAGDAALSALAIQLLADDEAHRDFFQGALIAIAETYPDVVADAVRRIADTQSDPTAAHALLTGLLDLRAA